MALSQIIINRIQKDGPISFRDFMEMSLYYPGLGYYTSEKNKIGEDGDYYTSCTLTPVFAGLLARQMEEMWKLSGEEEFTVVEYGAGTGCLCRDIICFLKSNSKLYDRLNYCIIEKSCFLREQQRIQQDEKVSWRESIQDIPEITGCVLSNELIDNFSVHRVVMGDELMEVFVDYQNDFVEILRPANTELKNYLAELKIELPRGFQTEINLEATEWIKDIAKILKKGYVLTIDYGYPSHELYCGQRSLGTLMCYNKHRVNTDPYKDIGKQDITAHVNFSALCLWGFKNGLDYCGFTDQGNFLAALGFRDYLKKTELKGQDYLNYKREVFLTNKLLIDMGSKFKVLIQQKALPKKKLQGLPYSVYN